jgi:hypothetical protein
MTGQGLTASLGLACLDGLESWLAARLLLDYLGSPRTLTRVREVLGLIGLVLFWVPVLGLLLAGVGIVLSAMGITQGRRTGASTGLAIAGLVCGIVGAIPGFLILLALAGASY